MDFILNKQIETGKLQSNLFNLLINLMSCKQSASPCVLISIVL